MAKRKPSYWKPNRTHFDEVEVLRMILRGRGSMSNDRPISSAYKYFDPDIPQRTFDSDKARLHLKEAGLENHTFNLLLQGLEL